MMIKMLRIASVIVGLVSLSVFANGQDDAPLAGSCEVDGFFPNEDQCDAYIHCWKGEPNAGLCPDGKVFITPKTIEEAEALTCSLPFTANCESRPALQEAQPSENCPRKWGLFLDLSDCQKFYHCVNGKAYSYDCPDGLAYNDKTGVCDWPDLVDRCDSSAFLGFKCPELTEFELLTDTYPRYPHPNDCRSYLFCSDGQPRLGMCENKEAFDPSTKECNLAENVSGCEDYYKKKKPE